MRLAIKTSIIYLLIAIIGNVGAEAQVADSIYRNIDLNEIEVRTNTHKPTPQAKSVASIEEHLLSSKQVGLIARGAYALEPTVSSMQAERVSTTIDGMKVFCACTDKMDPVTSYVETGNLGRIDITTGLGGDDNSSNQIGGAIDLKLKKAGFDGDSLLHLNAKGAYEFNGHLQVYGLDGYVSTARAYINAGTFYRHADNYKAGGGKEIEYSQYTKNNVFVNAGIKTSAVAEVELSAIYDLARNVGYPALTMDVKKAEGIITSVGFRHHSFTLLFPQWETKAYYNHVNHIMDDTKRKEVVMHMDMPGETETFGAYTNLRGMNDKHRYSVNFHIYRNRSVADMTMYPEDKNNPAMYMFTWPDVRHVNNSLTLSDEWRVSTKSSLNLSAKASLQHNNVHSNDGFRMLQIYAPDMDREENRISGDLAAKYQLRTGKNSLSVGTGIATRIPTISEQYGYFLFNTLDNYDYLGNPNLSNEKALEINASVAHNTSNVELSAEGNIFLFRDYIIGRVDDTLYRMTIGATGVKQYRNIEHATIANVSLNADFRVLTFVKLKNNIKWAAGRDENSDALPLIAPVEGRSGIDYNYGRLNITLDANWAAKQTNYGKEYGETQTDGYATINASARYRWRIGGKVFISSTIGIENITDKSYSTYSDWNNIPRKGRNIYFNINIGI